jgi:glutamine synthetase
MLIYAGLDGIEKNLKPAAPNNKNLFEVSETDTRHLKTLPMSIEEAKAAAASSRIVKKALPPKLFKQLK